MQHWWSKVKKLFIIGLLCFILLLASACGESGNNIGQPIPTDTPVAPFVTATPTPTDTPVAPFVTATPTPTDTPAP